jgi:imidazole glycerol-phosphate synthase subunit HisH
VKPKLTVGIVDYGVGNLASVWHALHQLGFRSRISNDTAVLDATDLLLLPGVGAYPAAMDALDRLELAGYLKLQARKGRPILGICLGMQLLSDSSTEYRLTQGLGLIPGQVVPLPPPSWHIGWNTIEVLHDDPLLKPSHGQSFYFNHSYVFETSPHYQSSVARLGRPLSIAVGRENVRGLQFHPEKSQDAGRRLLRNVITGMCP